MKETDVTIASNNLFDSVLSNYKDYKIIKDNFTYDELISSKKIIFYNVLNNLSKDKLDKLFNYLKENDIKYINISNNLETSLYTSYLICYDNDKIIIEGNTKEVLKNDKLLKRFGFQLPFMFELSLLLKDYDLINDIYLDKEELKEILWK